MRQLMVPDVERRSGVEMELADGTVLVADIYLPTDRESAPALLQRTPYGRVWAVAESFAPPTWYASRGFAVVCQDVRGTGDSGGIFDPFHREAQDGAETIAWIAAQPWCSGAVGMYGFSYPGVIQLLTAATHPPALRAIAPAMATANVHTPWLFRGGALQLGWVHRWMCDLGGAAAARAGDDEAATRFAMLAADPASLFGTLPLSETFDAGLRRHIPFLEEWLAHPPEDEYWQAIAPRHHHQAIDVPALHVTGWYDPFLEGAIENYCGLRREARAPQRLIAGPWTHVPWQRTSNGVDFGQAAASPVDEAQVAFFSHWLDDRRDQRADDLPVRAFVMGEDRWRGFTSWPPPESGSLTLHLLSDGRANSSGGTGRLALEPVGQAVPADVVVSDPSFPVSLPGGRSCCYPAVTPMGPSDQREEHQRNDVLVYASGPLREELTVIGSPQLVVFLASDAASMDLVAQLSIEDQLGRWINVSDANIRLAIGDRVVEVELRLSSTAFTVAAGRGVRLALCGSNYPTLDRNPHSGGSAVMAWAGELVVATHVVFHDSDRRSRLVLPVAPGDRGDARLTADTAGSGLA